MSIVISYYCDKFAFIATDTMVTSPFGSYEEDKLYNIGALPKGYCAGAGLESGIFLVRDAVSNITIANPNDISTAIQSIANNSNKGAFFDDSFTALSYGIPNPKAGSIEPRVEVISIKNTKTDIEFSKSLYKEEEFIVFAPKEYISHPTAEQYLKKLVPTPYKWDGNIQNFLMQVTSIFKFVRSYCPDEISKTCDMSFLFLDHNGKLQKYRVKVEIDDLFGSLLNESALFELLNLHTVESSQ